MPPTMKYSDLLAPWLRRFLLEHLRRAASVAAGTIHPAFAAGFPDAATVDKIYREVYVDVHTRWVERRIANWQPSG